MIDYKGKFCLSGKNAIVVGGAGLIGKEVVSALAQAGANVAIADINRKTGGALAMEMKKNRLNARYFYLNIEDIKNLKKNIKKITAKIKVVDIWVNVSYPRTKDFSSDPEKISYKSWQKNIDMHLNSYALSSKYIALLMKKIGGSIINFGSIYGVVGPDFSIYEGTNLKNSMIYSAIKGGIINLDRYLASYFGRYNIRVNTICPGGVFYKHKQVFLDNYSRKTPLKRMAKAEEVASVVLFLASEAASYITGATVMVDGGWTAI